MKDKILLMGKNGEYNIAEKNEEENELMPSSKKVYAREIVPYGFDFTFGGALKGKNYGIYGYTHPDYKKEMEEGKLEKHSDYKKVNLDRTIKGLEKDVKEIGADYVLIDNFKSEDMNTYWEISGRAQFFVKR